MSPGRTSRCGSATLSPLRTLGRSRVGEAALPSQSVTEQATHSSRTATTRSMPKILTTSQHLLQIQVSSLHVCSYPDDLTWCSFRNGAKPEMELFSITYTSAQGPSLPTSHHNCSTDSTSTRVAGFVNRPSQIYLHVRYRCESHPEMTGVTKSIIQPRISLPLSCACRQMPIENCKSQRRYV